MASYSMYSMTPSSFGGGVMDYLPNAEQAMTNANNASDFIFNMQKRRAASELLPTQLWSEQNKANYNGVLNEYNAMNVNAVQARNSFLDQCAKRGGTPEQCEAAFQKQWQEANTQGNQSTGMSSGGQLAQSMGVTPYQAPSAYYNNGVGIAPAQTPVTQYSGNVGAVKLYAPETSQNTYLNKTLFGG